MRLRTVVIIVALLGVLGAAPAAAHGVWYWSKKAAQKTLLREGLEWDEGFEEVFTARCTVQGSWICKAAHTSRLFRKFKCYVYTDAPAGEDSYYIRFLVQGKYRWKPVFLYYA